MQQYSSSVILGNIYMYLQHYVFTGVKKGYVMDSIIVQMDLTLFNASFLGASLANFILASG